jgi:hypothetical protein
VVKVDQSLYIPIIHHYWNLNKRGQISQSFPDLIIQRVWIGVWHLIGIWGLICQSHWKWNLAWLYTKTWVLVLVNYVVINPLHFSRILNPVEPPSRASSKTLDSTEHHLYSPMLPSLNNFEWRTVGNIFSVKNYENMVTSFICVLKWCSTSLRMEVGG